MSTDATQTVDQINAASERARTAQIAATVAGQTAPKSPAPAPKSAPKRNAASNAKSGKSAPKSSTSKSAPKSGAVKVTARKTTSGPTDRDVKRMVAQALVNLGADWLTKLPSKTVKGVKVVTLNGSDYPRATVLYAVKQTFGYTPSGVWSPKLGPRDVGRPNASKSAA